MWVSKNAKFDADFEYVEKIAKVSPKKRYEQQKIWYLIFISVCKGFRSITSISGKFFQPIRTQHRIFMHFMIPNSNFGKKCLLFILALFANFNAKRLQNGG
jgi:hypothetical protein